MSTKNIDGIRSAKKKVSAFYALGALPHYAIFAGYHLTISITLQPSQTGVACW